MRPSALLTIGLLLLLAAPATAGRLDPLRNELNLVRATHAATPDDKAAAKMVKVIDKLLAVIATVNPDTPLATELKVAAKVGKAVEKKLVGEANLQAILSATVDDFEQLLTDLRDAVEQASLLAGLDPKMQKGLVKSAAKMKKALTKMGTTGSPSKNLKLLGKAAKAAKVQPFLPGATEALWVISSLTVPPSTQGLDMDGDGTPDNNLGLISGLPGVPPELDFNQILADALTQGSTVILIQMWWVDDWNNDPLVAAGLMNGIDTDGDPSDNFSGSESFDTTGLTDAKGHALGRVGTSLGAGGSYRLEASGDGLEIPGLDLLTDMPLLIEGNAAPATNTGLIGFAIPLQIVLDIIAAQGIELTPILLLVLNALPDLDLDGDGVNEAVSGALAFDSVPAFSASAD